MQGLWLRSGIEAPARTFFKQLLRQSRAHALWRRDEGFCACASGPPVPEGLQGSPCRACALMSHGRALVASACAA